MFVEFCILIIGSKIDHLIVNLCQTIFIFEIKSVGS